MTGEVLFFSQAMTGCWRSWSGLAEALLFSGIWT